MWYHFGKSHPCVLLSWSSVVQNDENPELLSYKLQGMEVVTYIGTYIKMGIRQRFQLPGNVVISTRLHKLL